MAESALPSEKLHPDDHEPHAHSAVPYFVVWIVLLVFTAVTYVTGTMHLGGWALPIALT